MSVEDTLVKMQQDTQPPDYLSGNLWVSRPMVKRSTARGIAALAVRGVDAACPKFGAVRAEGGQWRGVVWAGRRSRREAAKAAL